MHKQLIVSIQDLRYVTILCRNCNTRATLDLAMEFTPPRASFYALRECPRCQVAFKAGVPEAIDAMQKVYKALADVGTVTFTGEAATPEDPE